MSTPRARKIQQFWTALESEHRGSAVNMQHLADAARHVEQGSDISNAAYFAMLGEIAREAAQDFALRFGGSRRLAEMGVVGHAIMSCETLRQALEIWTNFSSLAGDPFHYRSRVAGGVWSIDLYPAADMSPVLMRFCSEEWAASFCRFATETTGAACADAVIEFRHAALPGVRYADFLPAAPLFSARHNRISLAASILDAPILSHDDEMFELLLHHFARHQPERAGAGVAAQLRRLFFNSAGTVPKLAVAAEQLGFSARTLNRRLAAEGTSYAGVLAAYRSDYAQALARDGALGAKQIAHAVGYRSHQSLRREFSQWTGQPLGTWQKLKGRMPV